MNDMNRWFHEMEERELVSMSNTWIQQAVNQRHPRMTLDLAQSVPLVYDDVDYLLLRREILN